MAGPTILLVEDDPDTARMSSTILGHYGYEVVAHDTGEAAAAWAADNVPAMVLMDMTLPGIDGLETTRRLRQHAGFADVPIVALTAHAGDDWTERCAAAGCTDHRTKPIMPADLRALAEQYVDS
jgi:CheY-like chemotaxis protein